MAADDDSSLHLWLRPSPPDSRFPTPSPCSSSSSSSSPTTSSSISTRRRQASVQCAATAAPMTDLDAARALADFAHMALMERCDAAGRCTTRRSTSARKRAGYHEAGDGGGGETSGGSGRMDGKAQLEGGGRHRHGPRPLALDLNQKAIPSPSEELPQNATSGSIPDEQQQQQQPLGLHAFSQQPLKTEPSAGARLPFGAGARPKQSLSEAEKEAKRLRRVLANRESARQTIRRRQALREELTRKADSLSQENENMKKEKELMVKEYKLLKEINNRLKDKMAERMQHEAENPRPPEHAAPLEADPPPHPSPTPSRRHPAAAAPLVQHPQQRFPPLVPFAWPHPHLQVVSPFNLVSIDPNSKPVNLGCCYDQAPTAAAAAAAAALYVPPAAAYPAVFHPQLTVMHQDQPLFGGAACAVEGVGENPQPSPPRVGTASGDSSRTLMIAEPAKAKCVEEPPRCKRATTVFTEPKAKANVPLDRSSGKVFPLGVPEASSSSANDRNQAALNPEKMPLRFGTATEQSRKYQRQQASLLPLLNDKAAPGPSILHQPAPGPTPAAATEKQNLQNRRPATDETVDRRQKDSPEHLLKKAMDAAAARKRRRELTKLKQQYHQQRWKI